MEMVDSVDDFKSSRSTAERISKLRDTGREDCVCFEQDHPEFLLQEKRSASRNKKLRKRIGFFRGRQIGCMIYGYFRVTGAHDTVLDYAGLFSITLRNDDVQEFDTTRNFTVHDQDPT